MSMQAHVIHYNEPRIVLSSTRLVTSLSKGVGSVVGVILIIPLFIIMMLYYPILILALDVLKRKSAKLLSRTKEEYRSLEFKDASEYHKKIEETVKSIGNLAEDDVASKSVLLRPLVKRTNQVLKNFQEMEEIMRRSIYIDTSEKEYSSEEKELFSSLEEFFGGDPETYQKDTFEQLKSQRAEV